MFYVRTFIGKKSGEAVVFISLLRQSFKDEFTPKNERKRPDICWFKQKGNAWLRESRVNSCFGKKYHYEISIQSVAK